MRRRPTARLLVLDPADRLLLLLVEDAAFAIPRLWITPGGGVHPGESFEDAARRELWEETGIVAPLGPCVWTRRHILSFQGALVLLDERYFVVRATGTSVDMANVTEWERQAFTNHCWWSHGALAGTDEHVAPRCLATVLPPILAGHYPPEPVEIGL